MNSASWRSSGEEASRQPTSRLFHADRRLLRVHPPAHPALETPVDPEPLASVVRGAAPLVALSVAFSAVLLEPVTINNQFHYYLFVIFPPIIQGGGDSLKKTELSRWFGDDTEQRSLLD